LVIAGGNTTPDAGIVVGQEITQDTILDKPLVTTGEKTTDVSVTLNPIYIDGRPIVVLIPRRTKRESGLTRTRFRLTMRASLEIVHHTETIDDHDQNPHASFLLDGIVPLNDANGI
jgi:hypothetical protein